MPVVQENTSELLKDGYYRLRHPGESESPAQAYEARLRALRERKSPPLPSWKEIWNSLKDAWKEAGIVWERERANRMASKDKPSARTLQL